MMLNWTSILFLFLGWLLGLLSPVITDMIRSRRLMKEITKGILAELEEFRYDLVAKTYSLSLHVGSFDREFLKWVRSTMEDCKTVRYQDQKVRMLSGVTELLKCKDGDMQEVTEYFISDGTSARSLRKMELPFLDAKLDFISKFEINVQQNLLEIRTRVRTLNELIDESHEYLRMTFDSTISEENQERVQLNLDTSYVKINEQARLIADRIGKLKLP